MSELDSPFIVELFYLGHACISSIVCMCHYINKLQLYIIILNTHMELR